MAKRRHVFTVEEANVIINEIKPIMGGLIKSYRRGEFSNLDYQVKWLIRLANRLGFSINIRLGIVHFPTLYRGNYRAVLCYIYGEPRVMYWHWVDSVVRMRIKDSKLYGPSEGVKNEETG